MENNNKMLAVVSYYLGKYHVSMHKPALTQLANRLDASGNTYWCFWAFVVGIWEPRKIIHKNFIESPAVWSDFLEARKNAPEIVRVRVGLSLDKFRAECSVYPPDEVITDSSFMIEPIIKYVMAEGMGLTALADPHKKEAKQQLREEPLLFTYLRKFEKYMPISEQEVMAND
jgi:hypothetical protein